MNNKIDAYSDNFGNLNVPTDSRERVTMARDLLGYSLVHKLDYWLDFAIDKINNASPAEPYTRENEYAKRDRSLREPFANFDKEAKEAVLRLLSKTMSGLLFGILTDFDQFDFGELSIMLTTKSEDPVSIEITAPPEELHDELGEWIYEFSKYREQLVERTVSSFGTEYGFK